MTKILAIETATEACSAAVLIDDNDVIERFELAPREHTKLLLPMMDEVLEEAGITLSEVDAIAFSRGPGAFTGLRIAAGVAQGAALAVDIPVVPVSTLEALALLAVDLVHVAESGWQDDLVITALDARMGEVYWGIFCYRDDEIISLMKESVSKPEDMMAKVLSTVNEMKDTKVYAIGSGWDAHQDILFEQGKPEYLTHMKGALPKAENIAELGFLAYLRGEAVPPEEAQPVYIRNKVAEKSKKYSSV